MSASNDVAYPHQFPGPGQLTPPNPPFYGGGLGMDIPATKEVSVQDRLQSTLQMLIQAHGLLDDFEGGPSMGQASSEQPPLGLIGGALACQDSAARLSKRLAELRGRLGNL